MCGRYTLATPDPAAVRTRFAIGESIEVRRRYNIAPGDEVLAVTTDRDGLARGEMLRWGLVPWWARSSDTGLKMINARVETVTQRPAFSYAFEHFRCLIIADGFYEWRSVPSGPKQGFHITRDDGGLFAFAGLWSIWRGANGSKLRTCTILTTAASAAIEQLHDRMPIILAPEAEAQWLERGSDAGRLAGLLRELEPSRIAFRPVGPAVNDAHYDGPECLEAPVQAQPSLF